MSNEISWTLAIPVDQKPVADRLLWAMGLDSNTDPAVSHSFTIGLNSVEDVWPPTHYALAAWCDVDKVEERAAMPLNGGTLPALTRTLAAAGITEQEALDCCASIDPWFRTYNPALGQMMGITAQANFAAMCSARGLVRVFDPDA